MLLLLMSLAVVVNGGIRLQNSTVACAADLRGSLAAMFGSTGTSDATFLCGQDDSGEFAWKAISSASNVRGFSERFIVAANQEISTGHIVSAFGDQVTEGGGITVNMLRSTSVASGVSDVTIRQLSTTHVVQCFASAGNVFLASGTLANSQLVFNAEVNVLNAVSKPRMIVLTSNTTVLVYTAASQMNAIVIAIDGSSITVGTPSVLSTTVYDQTWISVVSCF